MHTNICWTHHKRDGVRRSARRKHATVADRKAQSALGILIGNVDKQLLVVPRMGCDPSRRSP